jgi:hypothetical protein
MQKPNYFRNPIKLKKDKKFTRSILIQRISSIPYKWRRTSRRTSIGSLIQNPSLHAGTIRQNNKEKNI